MSVRKHAIKLIAMALLALTAVTLLVSGTYAWFILGVSPGTQNTQLSIGGNHTIQVATDQTLEKNGTLIHYPGAFSETLSFGENEVGALTPVSTADGIHWYLPQYAALEEGGGLIGFGKEDDLAHANLGAGETEGGAYAYLDFWVVSPEDCLLRVSTSLSEDDAAGSFVLTKPQVVRENGSYRLDTQPSQAAACIRLGFLAERSEAPDAALEAYQGSTDYDEQYTTLLGRLQEPGAAPDEDAVTRFTIYEPNGDLHPSDSEEEGRYLITRPIGGENGETLEIKDRLTVQAQSHWKELLQQIFQTRISNRTFRDENAAADFFYENETPLLPEYVTSGAFAQSSEELYAGKSLSELAAGAAEDAVITPLRANVPQRVRLFLWLEGQDADCTNAAQGSSLLVRLELAGESTKLSSEGEET